MLGPIVNSSAVLVGGLVGAAFSKYIPDRLKENMPLVFGAASMAMGVNMIVKSNIMGVMVVSLLLGSLFGELIRLETGIGKAATSLNNFVGHFLPKPENLSEEDFLTQYVALIVLFCASGTGVFGALQEGMTGDSSVLIAKSALDLLTAAIFATTLGYAIAVISIPQFIVLATLFLTAGAIEPFMNEAAHGNFSGVGGAIMLATGFRIAGIKSFKIANMLPALLLAIPITSLWAMVF